MKVDFGKTASDYGRYRMGFPDRFFDRAMAAGYVSAGDRLLDLGTGTGTVARGFALRGCQVTGLDPSTSLLAEAARLDAARGVSIRQVVAKAEATGLAAASFEAVTAGQCWHWFDRPKAAAEVRRLLVPGGRLILCYYDWIPLPGNLTAATEALILEHNPGWKLHAGRAGVHPYWFADLSKGGFRDLESFSFDDDALYSHEGWRGRVRACAGVAASLPPAEVEAFDRELAELLARDFPQDPLPVLHRVWALCGRAP